MKNCLLKQRAASSPPQFESDANSSDTIPAFVGIGLLAEPAVKTDEYDLSFVETFIGDDAVITVGSTRKSNLPDDSPATLQSRSVRIKICDIVFTSVYDIDKRFIFVPADRLASLLNKEGQKPAGIVHIKCAAGFSPQQTVPAVWQIWTNFASEKLNWPHLYISDAEIMTSVAKQSQYTAELRKQMGVLLVIFGVISVGVVVLIFCIFYMIVTSKQKDLAIIKSIGGSSFTSASIFLTFGLFIGLTGASAGIGIGFAITHNVNTIERWIGLLFNLKLWSSSIYMFNRIPNHFNWHWAWWFSGMAVAASVLGALLPAIAAAKTVPAKILRYE
jgi:lipoprotein-releasing system permease protein